MCPRQKKCWLTSMPALTIRTRPEQCSNRRERVVSLAYCQSLGLCVPGRGAPLGWRRQRTARYAEGEPRNFDRLWVVVLLTPPAFCQASNCPVSCFDTLIRSRESCQYAPTHHLLPLALHSHVATAEPVTSGVRARYTTNPRIKDVVDTFLPLCAESQPTW